MECLVHKKGETFWACLGNSGKIFLHS